MSTVTQQDRTEVVDGSAYEFLILEFKALREEVLGKIERVVRIQLIGVTAIPLVIGAGEKYGIVTILAAAPLVTIIFALILLYEQAGIMRVGRYIRLHLEPLLLAQHLIGWEQWLEKYPINRRAETYFALSAYIAFSLYYLGGSYLAFLAVLKEYSRDVAMMLSAIYVGAFLLTLYIVVTSFAVSTKGREEPGDRT
jgi:hypothetical protein